MQLEKTPSATTRETQTSIIRFNCHWNANNNYQTVTELTAINAPCSTNTTTCRHNGSLDQKITSELTPDLTHNYVNKYSW